MISFSTLIESGCAGISFSIDHGVTCNTSVPTCLAWLPLPGKLRYQIIVLRLDFHPEKVLTLEQIQKLQRLPLEDVAGYVSRKVAVGRGVQDAAFPHIKVYTNPLPLNEDFCSKLAFDHIDAFRIFPCS